MSSLGLAAVGVEVGARQYNMRARQYKMGARQYSMGARQYSMGARQYNMGTRQYSMLQLWRPPRCATEKGRAEARPPQKKKKKKKRQAHREESCQKGRPNAKPGRPGWARDSSALAAGLFVVAPLLLVVLRPAVAVAAP
jgi:hypothetical protein